MNPTRIVKIQIKRLSRSAMNSVRTRLMTALFTCLIYQAASAQSDRFPFHPTQIAAVSQTRDAVTRENQVQTKDQPAAIDYRPIDRTLFKTASLEERSEIESNLLEIELACQLADRVGFTGRGNYFFVSREHDHDAISLRQFTVGWVIDNQHDRERIVLASQEQLPAPLQNADHGGSYSSNSHLDQIRHKKAYHEANGLIAYPSSKSSRLKKLFENEGLVFPSRAALSHPLDCWSGRSLERRLGLIDIERLSGTQKVGNDIIALFKFRPTPHYLFYVTIYFSERKPVQTDFWRWIAPANKQPDTDNLAEPEAGLTHAKHVATTVTTWVEMESLLLPATILSRTINEAQTIELAAEYQWFRNESVSPTAFGEDSCGKTSPFELFQIPESQELQNNRRSQIGTHSR